MSWVTRTRTIVEKLASSQKPPAGASLWSRWVNRPLGRLLAAQAIRAGVSANGVTALSALVTASALAVLCTVAPAPGVGVTVAVLLVLGFALDSADGQVARFTGTGSLSGEWLDHVVDAGKMAAVHAAVLVGWFRFVDVPSTTWLLVPLGFQLVAVVVYAGGTLEPLLLRGASRSTSRPASTLRAAALLPADFGILSLSFVLWGSPVAFRWSYLVLGAINLVIGAALLRRWFCRLRPQVHPVVESTDR